MQSFAVVTVAYCLFACALSYSVSTYAESETNHRSILVFGDSLSAAYRIEPELGWVSLLSQRLEERGLGWRVENRSESGATTLDGLVRIDFTLESTSPNIVILELGANDGLRGYPISGIRTNLIKLIDQIHKSGAVIVLAGMQLPQNYGPKYLDEFKALFSDLAKEKDTYLVPFFMEGVATEEGMMQDDGLHPTATGQPGLLENVWKVLEPLLQIEEQVTS